MKIYLFGFVTVCVLFYSIHTQTYAEEISSTLSKPVTSFSINSTSLVDALPKLMRAYQIRICIEEIPYDEIKDRIQVLDLTGNSYTKIKRKNISLNLPDCTIKDVLNGLTTADSDYTWEVGEAGVINIIPSDSTNRIKNNSILNWMVPSYSYLSTDLFRILGDPRSDNLGNTSFSKMLHDTNNIDASISISNKLYSSMTRSFKIKLDHAISARNFLNKCVNQADPGVYWNVSGYKNQRYITMGQAF